MINLFLFLFVGGKKKFNGELLCENFLPNKNFLTSSHTWLPHHRLFYIPFQV